MDLFFGFFWIIFMDLLLLWIFNSILIVLLLFLMDYYHCGFRQDVDGEYWIGNLEFLNLLC